MNLSINLNKQVLENEIIKIPFRFRQPEDTSFKISVDAHEISVVKVPVDCYSGDIIITEKHIDSLYIPEILTTAENGYANIEAHNPTDKRTTLTFKGPLTAIPFPDSAKENFNFFYSEQLLPEIIKVQQPCDIKNLIRIDHFNPEEKKAIISICKYYSDIFHKEN